VYRIGGGRWPGHIVYFLVWSTELVEVLQRAGATGYATYSIRLLRGRQRVPGYVGMRVFGKGGPFDPDRSGAEYCSDGGLIGYDRICMDESQWDGSDVFMIPGLGIGIFVVERVAEELMKLKLKNVSVRPADECSM